MDGNRGLGGWRGLGASKSGLKGREVISRQRNRITIEIYCLTFILVIYGRKWNYSDLTNSHEVIVEIQSLVG